MSTAKELYDLHVLDQQIRIQEDTLNQKVEQQRESEPLIVARERLTARSHRLENLKKQQRSIENSVADLSAKLKESEDQLYSGRIRNPKELSALQSEAEALKGRRDKQETELLGVMEQLEAAEKDAESASSEFKNVEANWRGEQQQLTGEIEQIKKSLVGLRDKHRALTGEIDAEAMDLYQRIRKSKGHAVARIEQGICCSCRISLSSNELHRARSGQPGTCSSCGRILYLP